MSLRGIGEGHISSVTFRTGDQLRGQDLRVANVAYRLSIANRVLCREALAAQPGFVLHGLGQYGPDDRGGAARIYGLGQFVGVMAVVKGSPAAAAGLAPDDQIVRVNGQNLIADVTLTDAPANRASVDHARQIISYAMDKGEVTLGVLKGQAYQEVRFAPDRGCPSNVELVPSMKVNAWADRRRIVVTDAILGRCRSDDDLALVIAHELAHNILGHGHKPAFPGAQSRSLLPVAGAGSAKTRENEESADRLAVTMAVAAGYDLTGAVPFLSGLLEGSGSDQLAATTHPRQARRLALLRAAVAVTGNAASVSAINLTQGIVAR